jgi:hypothetical protein
MKRILLPLFLATAVASLPEVDRAAEDDPLATLRTAHPRLLFTGEDQERIEKLAQADELLARLIERNHADATAMLREEPVKYDIPDGVRMLIQSTKCIQRVSAMALAYRLTGDKVFSGAAIEEMLIASKFKDWSPRHFLDTAEMTTALAIGYDWLYDVMEPTERQAIRQAIVEKGLNEGLKVYTAQSGWVRNDNNWNQVCNGGMILGALAVADEEQDLARKIITFALGSIPRGVSVYNPSGAYPEGPYYWYYGTKYTCLTISALQTALGHDFKIHSTPGLDRAGAFHIQTFGPTGRLFNYADAGTAIVGPSPAVFLLSRTFDNSSYAWWHRRQVAELLRSGRQFKNWPVPLEIAWYDKRGQQPTESELPRDALFKSRQDIVVMRSEWGNADAVYVAFKAGDNRTSHGHLDIGSFVLEAHGVRWAVDLGSDDYNLPGYWGPTRWQYYRLNNKSHNTLVIDEQIQNPSAKCNVVAFHSAPQRAAAMVDMSAAYQGQASSARRGIELLDRRAVHVRDELAGVNGEVRWGIVTEAQIELAGRQATLTQNGKTLRAEILAPAGARFEIVSTKPPTARERQNEGTRMLATRISADGTNPVVISILLQPTSNGEQAASIKDQPLDEWPGQ